MLLSLISLTLPVVAQSPRSISFRFELERAKAGDAESQYNVAEAYWEGRGVGQDQEQSLEWSRKSAAQDYWPAQLQLANHLSKPTKMRNEREAFLLYKKLADKGIPPGQHEVAMAYINGRETKADPQRGLEILQNLVKKRYGPSILVLAEFYAKGKYVEADPKRHEELLRAAAATDFGEARFRYYEFLTERGEKKKALSELRRAAQTGSPGGHQSSPPQNPKERAINEQSFCRSKDDRRHLDFLFPFLFRGLSCRAVQEAREGTSIR